MASSKRWREYLLLLINRGAIPGSTFIALATFQRVMTSSHFESFLLAWSLCQWMLAFGFQWQKNAAVTFSHHKDYFRISLATLFLSSLILSAFFWLFSRLANGEVLLGGLIYTMIAGALYYFSTNYRMIGSVTVYANVDTAFQVLRWAVAIAAVMLVSGPDSAFWGAALALTAPLLLFVFMRGGTVSSGPTLTWGMYLGTGIWMALFDFAGAGMMYVDRFYVKDTDYILHSTVSNQIGSVLFGALIATAYPRISLAWRSDDMQWSQEFWRMARFIPLLFIFTPILCVTMGPILLRILSPESRIDLGVLAVGGVAQSLHHIIAFVAILLIIFGKTYISALLYLLSIGAFLLTLILSGNQDWFFVSAMRCSFLLATLCAVGLVTSSFIRKRAVHVANIQG